MKSKEEFSLLRRAAGSGEDMRSRVADKKDRSIFTPLEIVFIISVIVLGAGIEFCFVTPAALQVSLMDAYDLSYYEYSLFFSLYSLPNVAHSIIGGFLIDRIIGIKLGAIIYISVALCGMALFAYGALVKAYWVLLIGRLVYGIGAEMSGTVCLNYFIYSWFNDSHVNLVYSLSDNTDYLGTVLAYSNSQRLYDYLGAYHDTRTALGLTLAVTSCFFLIPFMGGITMAVLKPQRCRPRDDHPIASSDRTVRLKDCLGFPPQFWALAVLYACYENAVFTLHDFQQDLLVQEFELSLTEANQVVNVMVVLQVLCAVPLSLAVDRLGRNTLCLLVSIAVAFLAHALICLRISPYISMSVLGMSYALMASTVWPMFAYPLEKKYHGLGYGIASCFHSLSSTICPMVAGEIIDTWGYFQAEYFYFTTLCASLVSAFVVHILDTESTGVLSMSAQERESYFIRKEKR